jgi:hypothetical protein
MLRPVKAHLCKLLQKKATRSTTWHKAPLQANLRNGLSIMA